MKKLLVVVDMQKDFIDGSLGTKEAEAIVPNVQKKMEVLEGRKLPVRHCIRGTDGWRLWEKLEGFEGKRFEKGTFGSVECGNYAAHGGYDIVELVGLCTDICVISNAMVIKAMAPELTVQVDERCCAGVTPESHEQALGAMKMCQIEVQ